MNTHYVIGVMSGTSLDGIDLAYVRFDYDDSWHFELLKSSAIEYDQDWRQRLHHANQLSGLELKKLDLSYGKMLGGEIRKFMLEHDLRPDLIVSHGHTVFHQPEIGLTRQIGDGYQIFSETSVKTVFDLRSMDVSLGGHGAPLVPVGDKLLFGNYDYCLNLGGFSNISFDQEGKRVAFDICPVNTVLNHLAKKKGIEFDENGQLAQSGRLNESLLSRLNHLPYYSAPPPKSLGIEWVYQHIFPLFNGIDTVDILHTYCHHITDQIVSAVVEARNNKPAVMLTTGGGAKNNFLVQLLKSQAGDALKIVIPDEHLVDFKEALIFAFLGLLRFLGKTNCYKSVTGARRDSSCGILIGD